MPSSKVPPPVNYATKPGFVPHVTNQRRTTDANENEIYAVSGEEAIFRRPIISADPCVLLGRRSHIVIPKSIAAAGATTGVPVPTNKFYSNLYLGDQLQPVYLLPYIVKWSGSGLDVHHVEEHQLVYGPDPHGSEPQYCFAPVGIVSLSLSAVEQPSSLCLSHSKEFSIRLVMACTTGTIESHLVRGSAFISATYANLQPEITSKVMIRNMQKSSDRTSNKWKLLLEDNTTWIVYAIGSVSLDLTMRSNRYLCASQKWSGLLQVAKLPKGDPGLAEYTLDLGAGTFPINVELDGRIKSEAQYSFCMQKIGGDPLLMYALPHHVESFEYCTKQGVCDLHLSSQMNGMMTLVIADRWDFHEGLPADNQLLSVPRFDLQHKDWVLEALEEDIKQDFDAQIRCDSMYFAGKALNKLAQLVLLASFTQHSSLPGLLKTLETNLLLFASNKQQYPLIYEDTWGGIVSTQGFTDRGDGSDFGNTWYNDHHYHYGYHISACAIYLDLCPQGTNRQMIEAWARLLARDVVSPQSDKWFSAYRAMDWFVGHSWSSGLYQSADGKNEESSSEDYHCTYALYLLAQVIGDHNLRDRSLIQLAVQRHSIQSYMLFPPGASGVPPRLLSNCISGIRFENKIDYVRHHIHQFRWLTC